LQRLVRQSYEAAVFKVGGKMFALVSLTGDEGSANLKCDPG
jgi:predicted DNA-binding protein (MmcQ/YjbR family)